MAVRVDNFQPDLFVNMSDREVVALGKMLKRSQSKLYNAHFNLSAEDFDSAMSTWYDHRDLLNDVDIEIIRRMH